MKKNTLIEVEWLDIVADSAWLSEQKASEFPVTPCKSVGYFLNKDKNVLRLSGTIQTGNSNERDINVIPIGVVKRIRRLK